MFMQQFFYDNTDLYFWLMIRSSFYVVIAALLFAGCKKSDITDSYVKLINASVDAPPMDVTFDGVLLIGNIAFPEASNVAFVPSGSPLARIIPSTGTATLATGNLSLAENTNYTIIAADSVHKLKVSTVQDDITPPATGKANIRFFHLSANTITVDINISGTPAYTVRSFNDQAANVSKAVFNSIDAGTYTFTAVETGTSNTIATSSVTLEAGKLYTIILKGAADAPTGTDHSVGFTVFKYN